MPPPDEYDQLLNDVLPKRSVSPRRRNPYDQLIDNTKSPGLWGATGSAAGEHQRTRMSGAATGVATDPYDEVIDSVVKRSTIRPRVGMGDVQQAQRETGRASTVNQTSDELRVMKGEQPVDRQGYSRQQDARTRLSGMRDESYRETQAREAKDAAWRTRNQPEIDRQTELYKQDIQKSGGDAAQWLTELGKKGAGQLLDALPGDTARIHAEAAQRAAEEESADRSQLSRGVQNIGAGFIGSAPELAAMALGAPPVVTFAAGSAIRSKSSDPLQVAEAAGHGAATGAAFELPGVGESAKRVLSGSAATGLGTAAVDLASGASPKEAAISGVTNAIMRGVPAAVRLRPRGKVNEGQRDIQSRPNETEAVRVSTDQRLRVGQATDSGIQAERSSVRGVQLEQGRVSGTPHHSEGQARRARNTESGKRGQFKKQRVSASETSYRTGQSVTVPFTRNTEGAQQHKPGYKEIVPGRYMVERPEGYRSPDARWEQGEVTFQNPLVLKFEEADATNWKDALSKQYGKTGKSLTDAIRSEGHDGIITYDRYGTQEIVDLSLPKSTSTATLKPRQQGVRSFPESVKEAGYQAESSTYDVLPNAETVSKADATIKAKGLDIAVAELSNKRGEFTPEDVAVGVRAIQQHTASGDIQKSVDVAEVLAERLTRAGQEVQAASLMARLSPEGSLVKAQRLLPKGVKLKPEQGEQIVAASKKVVAHETKLATLDERIAKMQTEAKAAKPRIGTLADRLNKLESEARQRLEQRKLAINKGSQAGASAIPLDIADYAIIGAAKLAQKGVTLATWTESMVKEFGEGIRPQLKGIYRESYRQYDEQRKQFATERDERGARKAGATTDTEIQSVINERALARKDARTARSELRSLYNDLSLTRGGKVKAVVGDILNVPRTMKSSVDLSAPRQGAMWMINHPVQGAKAFFGKQIKAMREVNYDRYVDQLESHPRYPQMVRSKLALTTVDARPHELSHREEAFMSRLAGKLPLIKHSERAYTTFLDTARSSWFDQLATQAEARAKTDGKPLTKEHYDAIANFVNIATGRGNLGKGTINNISPFLNAVFFAPKFAASKVQIFDPRVYARLPKGARRTAMREAATYFGAMTTAALLIKYGLGGDVTLDPEKSEFMKARVGNTRYDLANGTGQYVTLAARLLRNAENKRSGTKDAFGRSFADNIDRFTRYKYSPPAAFTRNVWEGKNAIGEKTSVGKESLQLVTPLFLNEMYEAFQEEGLTGVAKTSPGFVGVGVNTYGDRPQKPKRGKLKF